MAVAMKNIKGKYKDTNYKAQIKSNGKYSGRDNKNKHTEKGKMERGKRSYTRKTKQQRKKKREKVKEFSFAMNRCTNKRMWKKANVQGAEMHTP